MIIISEADIGDIIERILFSTLKKLIKVKFDKFQHDTLIIKTHLYFREFEFVF